jgi:hypothetical protein
VKKVTRLGIVIGFKSYKSFVRQTHHILFIHLGDVPETSRPFLTFGVKLIDVNLWITL